MWFYDTNYGGCNRFWYGGCEAGLNHFEDEQSCLDACVSPKGPLVCFLAKNTGSCPGVYNEWFFDIKMKTCSTFVYSGCLGNGNRFLTKSDCQDKCSAQDNLDLCMKPKMEGACNASFDRWYFDKDLVKCLACEFF